MYKAICFDFDGVMAETMPYHLPAWDIVLQEEYGFPLNPNSILLNEGRPVLEIARTVFKDADKPYDESILRNVIQKKNERFRATHHAAVYPENIEIIRWAKSQGIKIALVTGTKRDNLSVVLPQSLIDDLDAIITDGDTPRGKPSPDPYLAAAKQLNLTPDECLVVENAPIGITAAKAAGMFCIALKTTLSEEHLQQADVILSNHSELVQRLKLLLPSK